jgi:ABC-type oligopeptide transport system substrate-binding subunit
MNSTISRRGLLAAPLGLAGCASANPYFGRTLPPDKQRLVHSNGEEPNSLDPALAAGNKGETIVAALLESLTALDPVTLQPMAALATHYDVDSSGTRYTFYLRGHANPRGVRLLNTDDLPQEFSRGRRAPLDSIPARWSDGALVTAHDFVASWRRFVDPATAAWAAYCMSPLRNADAIVRGLVPAAELGVGAVDDFTFQFDLVAPIPSFLKLLWQPCLAAVPQQALEAARRKGRESSWTDPDHYVSSGPFLLREWKPNDRVVLTRNPLYWEADSVTIEEIVFLPVSNGTTNVNLYKAGAMQSMDPRIIPPLFVPALRKKKDFATSRAFRTFSYTFNVANAPLDRLPIRYALNLATDKVAIVKFLGADQKPAHGVVPPMAGYPSLQALPVSIYGRELNMLTFDPRAARELLRAEGISDLELSLIIAARPSSSEIAAIVQRQWREHLGIRLSLSVQEEKVWVQTFIQKQYRQIIEDTWTFFCEDPNDYLMQVAAPAHIYTWTDARYDRDFTEANEIPVPAERMKALAACETQLIRSMPMIPIFHDTWAYLEAPYLHCVKPNPFGHLRFKYAWIDTNWRPS